MKGWGQKKLSDLCEFKNGLWKGKKGPFVKVGIIRNTNFCADGSIDLSDVAYHDVEEKQYNSRKLEFGDIILEKSGGGPKQPVGRVVYFDISKDEYSFSNFTSLIRVKKNDEIDSQFLHRVLYWFYASGVTESMQRRSTGIRNLNFNDYKQLYVPLPPLPEQRRIVAILDEAFAAIATATANTEKNIANARKMFDTELELLFKSLSGSSKAMKLDDLGIIQTGSTPSTSNKNYYGSFIPFIKPGDFYRDGSINYSNEGLSESGSNVARCIPAESILMVCIGATIGKVGYNEMVVTTNQQINSLTPFKKYNYRFIYYYMRSKRFYNEVLNNSSQATIPIINKSKWKKLSIAMPEKRRDQDNVVDKLDALTERMDQYITICSEKSSVLEKLKQSLLHHAFTGQLTAEPERAERMLAEAGV